MIKLIHFNGLSPEEVLAALFNASKPKELRCMQPGSGPQIMTVEGARAKIQERTRMGLNGLEFIEIDGHLICVNLEGDSMAPGLYDRANGGDGAAQKAIDSLRANQVAIDNFSAEVLESRRQPQLS
jgi:hypothetical protein